MLNDVDFENKYLHGGKKQTLDCLDIMKCKFALYYFHITVLSYFYISLFHIHSCRRIPLNKQRREA